MLNSKQGPKSQRRKSSRSDSASSSSVVTVKRTLSSRSGTRTPRAKVRSPSPDQLSSNLAALTTSNVDWSQSHQENEPRRPPNIATDIRGGVGNLHRWSQSTASSRGSEQSNEQRVRENGKYSLKLDITASSMSGATTQVSKPRPAPMRKVALKSRYQTNGGTQQTSPSSVGSGSTLTQVVSLPSSLYHRGSSINTSTSYASPHTFDRMSSSTQKTHLPSDFYAEKVKKNPHSSAQHIGIGAIKSASEKDLSRLWGSNRKGSLPEIAVATTRIPMVSASPSSTELPAQKQPRSSDTRNREEKKKSSNGNEQRSSTSSSKSEREQNGKYKSPSQKSMLSKALAKANTAVLLDNAHNFEGAIVAYADACKLLQHSMIRNSGDEDKKKLEMICATYTSRIEELRDLEAMFQSTDGKTLPDRPLSDQTISPTPTVEYTEPSVTDTSRATRPIENEDAAEPEHSWLLATTIPSRGDSLLPPSFYDTSRIESLSIPPDQTYSRSPSRSPRRLEPLSLLGAPMEPQFMPRPLSPRRTTSSNTLSLETPIEQLYPPSAPFHKSKHSRDPSIESTSWLDTIDESGGSSSSIRSRSSSMEFRQRAMGFLVDETDSLFSAALDAAVDAAYEEDSDLGEDLLHGGLHHDYSGLNIQSIEPAEQPGRQDIRHPDSFEEVEIREERDRPLDGNMEYYPDFLDDEAEEEERLLDEMTQGYVMDDFQFDARSKSALPRTSDSSGFSGRTWGSSRGSNNTTLGTSLTTLTEGAESPSTQKIPPPHPPPAGALPMLPDSMVQASASQPSSVSLHQPPSFTTSPSLGVRDRRLSGQNARQLTIETNPKLASLQPPGFVPLSRSPIDEETKPTSATSQASQVPANISIQKRSPMSSASVDTRQTTQPTRHSTTGSVDLSVDFLSTGSQNINNGTTPLPPTPTRFVGKLTPPGETIQQDTSSSSLNARDSSLATSATSDLSPITPNSEGLPIMVHHRKDVTATMPVMPTPTGSSFTVNGLPAEGMYLFDDHTRTPSSSSSQNQRFSNAPAPLEPCPESFLLRPFWLMRCLYQTIAHPRGGYLSTKLFVPRDVWRVKNVKIKCLDDKVSQCDLLTAALLKLAKVDNLDADAMLDEMQAFETVLDQVRATLQKKLGSEVGVQGSAALFKGMPTSEETGSHADPLTFKSGNVPGKSYLASWRKLRSKNSGATISASFAGSLSKEGNKEVMTSLPMTAILTAKPHAPKRNVQQIQYTGPNANYMGSLARLFDAAQVLDLIAREVEDPGLKCSSKTHVGLELSTRNAAEFFGFFVCRFALNDVGMMLDKFIKRGSEWVLA